MTPEAPIEGHPRVAAVSYLNTVPLVWGMLHGPQRDRFDLSFCTPAVCADRLETGAADIGIVPAVEIPRLGLEVIPGASISCHGPVRSILLVATKPIAEIRTLAADTGSRTSVMLARIILADRYGAQPRFLPMAPDLDAMLASADAALIIGDPALHIDPAALPHQVLDLGEEWTRWTGKPMVFAVWAGPPQLPLDEMAAAFRGSARYGVEHIDEIVATEAPRRGIPESLARAYLTRHISYDLGQNEREGLQLFLEYASRGVTA